MNNTTLQLTKVMKQTNSPQSVAPSEAQETNLPVESAAPPAEAILKPATTTARPAHDSLDWGETRYYAQHWGINE